MAGSSVCPTSASTSCYCVSVSYSCSRTGPSSLGLTHALLFQGLRGRWQRQQRSGYQFPRLSLCCACFSQYQFGEQLIAGKVGVGNMDKVLEKSGVFRSWNQHPSTTRRFAAWDSRMDADARSAAPRTTVGEEFSDSSMSSMNGAGRDPYVVLSLGSLSRHVPLQRLAVWTAVVITMFQLHDFVGVSSKVSCQSLSVKISAAIS
jgi:hypothetical protein